ncbi:MAG: hypothetical protein AAFR81_22565 [Chloroflexota bacterium]
MSVSRLINAVLVMSLVLAGILAFDLVPFLRGGEIFRWQWNYIPVPIARAMVFAGLVVIFALVMLWLAMRERTRLGLAWAFSGTIVLTLGATWARTGDAAAELLYRTVSLGATGPATASGLIDWSDGNWFDWTTIMASFNGVSQHVELSPPGLPLIHHAATRFFETTPALAESLQQGLLPYQCHNYTLLQLAPAEWASMWVALLMPLWAGLAVFPLYAVAKKLLGEDAIYVAGLWALIPAVVMYGGSWNTAYPLLAIGSFYWLLRGLDDSRFAPLFAILSGVLTGILTFANFSVVPLGLLFGWYTLLHYIFHEREEHSFARPVLVGLWYGLGVLLPWGMYMLAGGDSPIAMLDVAFGTHLELERPFVPWLWMHTWEWLLLGSVPAGVLWLVATVRRDNVSVLPLALLLTMVIMLLSNTARGETGRVWLFFTPFVLVAASHLVTKITLKSATGWWQLYVAQASLTVALVATWFVMGAGDIAPRPPAPELTAATRPVQITVNEQFTLVGWEGVYDTETNAITLALHWQSHAQMTPPYYFAVLPVAPDGSTGESVVWQPQATNYPTTCWLPDSVIQDTIVIPMPENPAEGGWYLSVTSFADTENPQMTLPVVLPDGTPDSQMGLGPVIVD